MTDVRRKGGKDEERGLYFLSNVSKAHPAQTKLLEVTRMKLDPSVSRMLSSEDSMVLLTNMIKFAGAKRCIEVGVFTGYSALSCALNIPDDGKVVACDISTEYADIGKPIWKEAGVDHKIDLRIGNAADTLQAMIDAGESGSYDFVYIDADKTGYDDYYELSLKLLRAGGIIAIDNTWWYGRLLQADDTSADTVAIRDLNAKIAKDTRVSAVLLDAGDGTYICLKK